MPTLVFDIETIGHNFDDFDEETQESLTWWARENSKNKQEYKTELKMIKERLGLSPLTGEIVCLGVMDVEKNQGVIYFQAPQQKIKDFKKDNFLFKRKTEPEMLQAFWQGVQKYDQFAGFNSRSFDVPFIMARSAKHKIKPTKNLMSNRYLSSQFDKAKHIDLLDQLTFYGAVWKKKGNLHLWCRLFDIKSPKSQDVKGEDVAKLFEQGEYKKIAKYNSRDLVATKQLYQRWHEFYF